LFAYQKTNRYFAQTADGVTDLACRELSTLGAKDVQPAFRGLYFNADNQTLYRVNLASSLCSRITAPLLLFDCHSTNYLQQTAAKIPWHLLLNEDQTFAITATVVNSSINHSQYAALCLKDVIVDYFRDRCGKRPSIDRRTPDLWLDLHIDKNKATISIDTSGGSLHRRGYRTESMEAPMQETLAATIIKLSEWDGDRPLIDPMCGSGTLLGEALLHYCRIPAAFQRLRFGFMALPDFDAELWEKVLDDAEAQVRALPLGLINGSDIDDKAITMARVNLAGLPNGDSITLTTLPFQKIDSIKNATIVCNPPYGIRLKNKEQAVALIEDFGNFLKHRCTGSTAYIYLGKRELLKAVGLHPSWKKPLKSGGLDGVLAKYELY
jgi:putative N6-adenine-specific DNA methylase